MRHIFVFLTIFSAFVAKAPGQALFDVVASLSDRQRVVVQRDQVRIQLGNEYGNGSVDVPGDDPIDWIGVGTNPSELAVNGLDIGSRIALLNQAVAEFDRLAPAYANMSPAELEGTEPGAGPPGGISFYRAGDFTPLPRATPENHQEILRQLAQRLRALRVLLWPSAFETSSFSATIHVWEDVEYDDDDNPYKVLLPEGSGSVTWTPGQIGADNVPVGEPSSNFSVGVSAGASVSVSGRYDEESSADEDTPEPLREQTLSFSGNYPKRAVVRATAQGADGTQIGGTVKILSRSQWHQLTVAGAPSRFNPANGSFVIEGGGDSGDVPLFTEPPGTNVSGTWVTTLSGSDEYGSYLTKHFVETGYQLKAASLLASGDTGYSDAFHHSYEKNWNIGCHVFSLFLPNFARGVDAPSARTKIDSVNRVLADNTRDGAMRLHPRPNLLFGIEIGPGLNGAGDGMLTAGTMADALENESDYGTTGLTYGQSDAVLVNRFDSSYALRFAGSTADYHVVYDNNRTGRTQTLPQLNWSYTDPYFGASHDEWTLYGAWDSPRLKQVVGRDLIANITYNTSHYGGYTITVYRRSENATAPVAGQPVSIDNLPVVRTWTFSKPDAGTTAHPTDAEKLQADGLGNEKFEIYAEHSLLNNGAGWDDWYDYSYALWGGTWTTAWWWYLEGDYKWILKLSEGETEKYRKEIAIESTNLSPEPWIYDFEYAMTIGTFKDGDSVGALTSDTLDPFGDASPSDWKYEAAGKAIVGTPAPAELDNKAFRYGKLATSLGIDYDGVRPDLDAAWDANGLLDSLVEGDWETDGEPEGDGYKVVRKFNDQTIATEWFEFTGLAALKHYSAPDGANVSKGHSSVAWTEVEMGTLSSGQPGLPNKVSRSDGSGATFEWTIGADGAGSLVASDGLLSGGGVTKGAEVTTEWNKRGFTTLASNNLLLGGTLKTSGAAVPSGEFTAWGTPLKWKDDFSTVASSWTFDGSRSRTASMTSALGLTTSLSGYDVLDRPGTVAANGISASNTFTGLTTETEFSGTDIQGGTENTTTQDALGRLTTSNTTWNGVMDNLGLIHGGTTVDVTRTVGSYGTETSKIRKADGSLQEADGPTLPFDGVSGDELSVSDGLLVSRKEILDEQGQGTGAFEKTHTDAWGRVRKVLTPSKSGTESTTSISYSDPDSSVRRVITVEPSGRVSITESEPYGDNGSVTRSGIDLNFTSVETASLGGSDRYTQSITAVSGGKLATTLSVSDEEGSNVTNGMRTVMHSEWTPSTGKTETWINGNEEKITTTPNKPNRTVETTSTKGWTRNTALNSLGLPTGNTLSGTGIPTTGLTPVWRADGSLASVELTISGETHSASFNNDGTLSSLTAPGRGNILGGHTINNGVETLTVDGVTVESRLNGTKNVTSGGNIVGKTEELTARGGLKLTVTPEVGEDTKTHLNAAFAPTSKTYADDSGESYGYTDELLTSVSLARGGNLVFGYSPDSAKDLSTATWPTVASGVFTIPGLAHGFTYNRAGQIKTVGDPSGVRSLAYQNGRLTSTAYTAGLLRGNEVIRIHDASGRHTGILLKRDGATIHTTEKAPNGASDQITDLASGGITATPQRDAAGRITGYIWSDGTSNSVTQTWQRGAGGRIEFAGSNVPGAPTFDYLLNSGDPAESFDTRNRRLKCATAGGTWTYTYGINGQLTKAIHEDASDQVILGDFNYTFDAIGRRTDMGAANTSNLLNQSTAWTNSQPKKLTITADPGAKVKLGIGNATPSEISGFTGRHQVTLGTPGATGQWIEWSTLAILEGQGEGAGSPPANPLASPDAKAEKHGAAWIPPAQETLAYDVAGNRQGNSLWDYGWDAKNQLVRARTKNHVATEGNPAAPHAYDITYAYDAEGRRVRKHVVEYRDGSIVSQKTITFVWDGWDLVYERQQLPSGLTTHERKYLWGPDIADGSAGGAGGLLLIQETKGNATQKIIPLYDGTGHVVALTNLNKDLLASYTYGPFGEKISATGPLASSNPWRWGTKYFDEETGLYYFGLRYYDPVTCQWLSRELLGESESANLYQFAGNDPINHVDVQGLAKHRIAPDAVPVLVSEGDGVWAFYVKAELEGTEYRMTSPGGYGSYPSGYYASVWKDAGALRVGGQVGDNTAARFLNGECSNQEIADMMRLANLQTEQMNAESDVEALHTAGQFIPGVGAGVALAEGDGIRGSAYFVRDVVLTVTGTKLLQGGKTLAGMTLRGAGLGAMQGATSAGFDIGAGRAQAAWNGESYAGTVNGDAWEMFRATRNGAAFGLVLGPVAKMASLRSAGTSNAVTTVEKGLLGEAAASRALTRAGYTELPARLGRNNGFDGVWIKRGANNSILDLIISESKFTSTGRASLTKTKTMGRQLSDEWITANIDKMLNSADAGVRATGRLLNSSRHLIRTKANALAPSGTNRWNVITRP